MSRRQLVLNSFFMRFGHHPAAWRHPSATGDGRPNARYWVDLAKLAEEAKFDAFFLADFIGRSGDDVVEASRRGGSFQFEPLTLLSLIAGATKNIGLIATINTNFSEPYNVARLLASLDHLSDGRAGWNVVSSLSPHTAKNFGMGDVLEHGERYDRAAEFVTLAKRLWDSWDDQAFDRPDRAAGQFFDPAHAHPVHHQGEHFRADGLLDVARPIQGYPVFVQAGNSDTGRELAAQIAEMTYSSATSLAVAKGYYDDVKGRMAKYGRDPDQLKVTPGLSVVVGETDSEAREKFEELQHAIDFSKGVELMGVDISRFDLDAPLPDDVEAGANGKGRFKQMVELGRRENLTVRQLVWRFGVNRGHVQAVGSVKTVVDTMQEWFEEGGADGFNVVPPLLPSGFHDFVRGVVPELQRRGLHRREYTGKTLRENMGLARPGNSLSRATRSAAE
ncbi:MAG: LLM class flavin-dependent oxidoreductase [Polyangiales bacterium]